VALADVVDRLPISAHGETGSSKTVDCLDQSRKILFGHEAFPRNVLTLWRAPPRKPSGARLSIVEIDDVVTNPTVSL
jgi:hypothetical protein